MGLHTALEPTLLRPLQPLPTIRFPTMSDLLEQEMSAPIEPVDDGLFSQLVRDPRVLYREYLEDPEVFDEETALLLQQLVSNQKKLEDLTAEEKDRLNRATAEFTQYSPKPKKPQEQPRSTSSRSESSYEDEEEELPWMKDAPSMILPSLESPMDLPVSTSFWWKKP